MLERCHLRRQRLHALLGSNPFFWREAPSPLSSSPSLLSQASEALCVHSSSSSVRGRRRPAPGNGSPGGIAGGAVAPAAPRGDMVLPAAAPGPGADEKEAAPGAGEDHRVWAADEKPASDGHILVDTGNGGESDEEEAMSSAKEDPRARAFSVGTLAEISSNGCQVGEPTSAPSAGETSDTLRFFAPLGAVNNRTSPARASSSDPCSNGQPSRSGYVN